MNDEYLDLEWSRLTFLDDFEINSEEDDYDPKVTDIDIQLDEDDFQPCIILYP